MKLTYGQLELTLASHLRVDPDKVATLRSRIKQLQRLGFPPGVNIGRGARMEYTGEHLFMLVTVFELIGFGLPAQTACNVVNEHWPQFAAGYALAALQKRRHTEDEPEQVLAILWLQSLHEIQFRPEYAPVKASEVKICDEGAGQRELRPYDFDHHYSRLFLSIGKLLERVLKIAKKHAGVTRASIYDEDFHAWLPRGKKNGFDFQKYYPDRSNLEIRQELHHYYGNDPDSFTPDGMEEAQEFLRNNYSSSASF